MHDLHQDHGKYKAVQKRFNYQWKSGDCKIDTTISVPPHLSVDEHLAILCSTNRIPVYVRDDLRNSLAAFLETETTRFYDDEADSVIHAFDDKSLDNPDQINMLASNLLASFETNHIVFAPSQMISNDDVFREAYQSLLKADLIFVGQLLKKESEFAKEMQTLIKERDWEVERLKKEHRIMIEKIVSEIGTTYSEQQVNRIASEHFERLHMTESNYASQITSLAAEQRKTYRELVLRLNEESLSNSGPRGDSLFSDDQGTPDDDRNERGVVRPRAETMRLEESFTIHLGAQQKTMHNLRLISMDPIELCRQKTRVLEESRRLQMALSLYSGQLHGVVLLVDSRTNHHVNLRTDFARACEQTTELHFPDLETQLNNILNNTERANEWRYARTAAQSDSSFDAEAVNSTGMKNTTLRTGDVYLTRHSNLSEVHVVFHLVTDDALQTQDINSRHSCINGLRNIIRLCYKFDITTISLPLLLLRAMTEELTVSWCAKRAELVFKCVKGFMMECATLSGAAEQYTVQFLVPPDVSADVFHQLSDMLLSIFHLAKAVVVAPARSTR